MYSRAITNPSKFWNLQVYLPTFRQPFPVYVVATEEVESYYECFKYGA